MAATNKISVYGSFGFVLGEFCRQYQDEIIRVPKHEVVPYSKHILYGISTTDNYNVFDNVTLDIETNLIHLVEVLDACYKTFKNDFTFTFVSSWFVYGKNGEEKNFEDSPCNPTGFYSITKRAAEQLLISYCETYGIKYHILRLANVLGSRDFKMSKKKNALQFLINRLVHNEDVELYDGGQFYRDYIDVRDCAKAIHACMEHAKYSIYNISNGKSSLFKDLINFSVKYSGSKSNVWDKPTNPEFHSVVQSKNIFLDNSRLLETGYVQSIPIEQSLTDIIDSYKGKNKNGN